MPPAPMQIEPLASSSLLPSEPLVENTQSNGGALPTNRMGMDNRGEEFCSGTVPGASMVVVRLASGRELNLDMQPGEAVRELARRVEDAADFHGRVVLVSADGVPLAEDSSALECIPDGHVVTAVLQAYSLDRPDRVSPTVRMQIQIARDWVHHRGFTGDHYDAAFETSSWRLFAQAIHVQEADAKVTLYEFEGKRFFEFLYQSGDNDYGLVFAQDSIDPLVEINDCCRQPLQDGAPDKLWLCGAHVIEQIYTMDS